MVWGRFFRSLSFVILLVSSACQKHYTDFTDDVFDAALSGLAMATGKQDVAVQLSCQGNCGEDCPDILAVFSAENGIEMVCPCHNCYPGLSILDSTDLKPAFPLRITLKPKQTTYLRTFLNHAHGTDSVYVVAFEHYPGIGAEALHMEYRTSEGGKAHNILLVTGLPRIGIAMPHTPDMIYACQPEIGMESTGCRPIYHRESGEVACSDASCRLETYQYAMMDTSLMQPVSNPARNQ